MTALTRRRFISISAAVLAVPTGAGAQPSASWRGAAMGAGARMKIVGLNQTEAKGLFRAVETEINRLEDIFSLYRPQSALCRLNQTGRLVLPPFEMLDLMSISGAVHAATQGAFDPTIQPTWAAHRAIAEGKKYGSMSLETAKALTGWSNVRFDSTGISFARDGMALTFNGIAQGYMADRVADLLRRQGFHNVLVDMGEIVALGNRPDGRGWRAGIVPPGQGEPEVVTKISDRALATSAPLGTVFNGGAGHILDPRSGYPGARWTLVSVSAGRAAVADGLSTAFCLMEQEEIDAALRVFTDAKIEYLGDAVGEM